MLLNIGVYLVKAGIGICRIVFIYDHYYLNKFCNGDCFEGCAFSQ